MRLQKSSDKKPIFSAKNRYFFPSFSLIFTHFPSIWEGKKYQDFYFKRDHKKNKNIRKYKKSIKYLKKYQKSIKKYQKVSEPLKIYGAKWSLSLFFPFVSHHKTILIVFLLIFLKIRGKKVSLKNIQ